MILLDANIFMYAAGAPHPCKAPSVALLHQIARGEVVAAVDAETLQEILHRYRAMGRWSDGARVYDLARTVVPDVVPITGAVLDRARALMDASPALMARDALHAAVVLLGDFEALCSYDRDFDAIPGLVRMEPK
jgi:hypothetical protein